MTSTKIQINLNNSNYNTCTEHSRSIQCCLGHPPTQSAFGTVSKVW